MNEKLDSAAVAKQFGISQRHARRMILAGDSRLESVEREWFKKCSGKRLAEVCMRQSVVVGVAAGVLAQAPAAETLNKGPEIDQLHDIVVRLRRCASDLRSLAGEFDPE